MKQPSSHPPSSAPRPPRPDLHPRCLLLASYLAEERRRRGWTLGELARRVEVSRQTVANVETGRTAATADLLCRIEDVCWLRIGSLWVRAFREEAGLVPERG